MSNLEKNRKKALKLKREMDEIDRQHMRFVQLVDAEEKARRKKGNLNASDKMLSKQCSLFAKKEQEAYSKYHKFMHKEFDINNGTVSFNNPKYKNGFCDKLYINDLYSNKKKELVKAKADRKEKRKCKCKSKKK